MNRFGPLIVLVFPLLLLASGFAVATDDSKVKGEGSTPPGEDPLRGLTLEARRPRSRTAAVTARRGQP
jgi:hypothetical protein